MKAKTLGRRCRSISQRADRRGAHLVTPTTICQGRSATQGPIYHLLGLKRPSSRENTQGVGPGQLHLRPDSPTPTTASYHQTDFGEAYRRHHLRTNNEFGFDYARQHGAGCRRTVQRELHYAIIDRVDNILGDEARTRSSSPVSRAKLNYYVWLCRPGQNA